MLSDEEKKEIEDLKRHIIPFELNDILLDLIERQQKEIEELKEINEEMGKALDEWNNGERTSIFHIHKDKIKAKIEEYKKQIEKMEKDDVGIGFTLGKEWSDLKAKVEFGQSLLEKEYIYDRNNKR